MALTISTHPSEVITNAPEFTVTTSLTEGASYQNLRIRATVYIGGETEAVAVLEQPKGLDDWDFFDLLRSFIGKCDEAVDGSDFHIGPTVGSELLTSWSNYMSGFSTFVTSGTAITNASSSGAAFAHSNDLGTDAIGDIYVVGVETITDSGITKAYLACESSGNLRDAETKYAGLSGSALQANHIYFLMAHDVAATPHVALAVDGLSTITNFDATIHKISDFKNNPGVYFHIQFEEIYENASDVTTTGAEKWADTMLFIPAHVRPGESFSDFLVTAASKAPLSRAEDGGKNYKFGQEMEQRIMYAAVCPWVKAEAAFDAAGPVQNNQVNAGWGIFIINDNYGLDADDEDIVFTLSSVIASVVQYEGFEITVPFELNCFPNLKALAFIGDLGEETILFKGLTTKAGSAEKSFYKNQQRIRKVLRAYRKITQTLRTLNETEETRMLLHELVYTEDDVWMYGSDYEDGYTDVTVISDETPLIEQDELIASEIDIEYYE